MQQAALAAKRAEMASRAKAEPKKRAETLQDVPNAQSPHRPTSGRFLTRRNGIVGGTGGDKPPTQHMLSTTHEVLRSF